jgi:hypothetical protein
VQASHGSEQVGGPERLGEAGDAAGHQAGVAPVITRQRPRPDPDHWFVRCNIAGAAAAYSDVFVLQDQVNTTNLTEFDYLYNTTRSQALAASPQVKVDAEVSTNYGTPDQMAAAAQSVGADGYYISATSPTIAQADQFLQDMQAAGY